MSGTGNSYTDNDLQDLKQRYELLDGDRRAYYETSQWALRQNRAEIEALEQKNKTLREAVARLKKEDSAPSSPLASSSDIGNDSARLEYQLRELAKKHDDLQNELRVKEALRQKCFDEVEAVERELELVRKHREESDQAKELRSLESRLDTTNTKYNEALAVRRTYDAILQALQAERLSFDSRLGEFEKNVRQKQHEADELEEISREAEKGKEKAWLELQELETKITGEREQRQSSLQAQRDLMHRGTEENQLLESQLLEQGDDEEDRRSEVSATSRSGRGRDREASEAGDAAFQAQLLVVEESIRAFKEATGCSDIGELPAKFNTQYDKVQKLSQAMADNEKECENLRVELSNVEGELQKAKYTLRGDVVSDEARIHELEHLLQAAKRQRDDIKKEYLSADSFLEQLMDGVQYLHDRLHGKEETVETVVTRHNLAQKLSLCSEKIARIYEQVKSKEDLIESLYGNGRNSLLFLSPPATLKPTSQIQPEPTREDHSDSEDTLFAYRDAIKRRWEEIREAQKAGGESTGGGFSLGRASMAGPRLREQ